MVSTATGIFAQFYRYQRVSSLVERQQTKWVVLGFAASFFGIVMGLLPFIFFASTLSSMSSPVSSRADLFYRVIYIFVFSFIPIFTLPLSFGVSVLRYRLWDVDLALNRGLVYGTLTVILSIVFFAGLLVLQAILNAVLGGQQTSVAAIISTAVILGLFNPARRQLQNVVDRRFFRLRVDLNQLAAAQKLPNIKTPGALSGRKLGDYDVLDVIGKGGMGEVYKSHANNQTVALKILPDDLAQEEDFRKRFEREGQALTALHHPNIVKMYGSGASDNIAYLAMEYIDGEDLGKKLKADGKLSLDDARDILKGLTAALDYAHEQVFVHRDIKPSNVMLRKSSDGETWEGVLMDFGVAKIREAQTGLTKTGAVGTIEYMAPEQIMAAKAVDGRADVYALGVMTYEMLTGERPFKGSPAQVMFAHLQQPPPDPRDVKDDIPSAAAKAIMQAMTKKPEERFETAGDFAAALTE